MFTINESINVIEVVYPKIGEILAECFGILNIVMVIGIFGKLKSQIEIYDLGILLLIKYYYKKLYSYFKINDKIKTQNLTLIFDS